MIDRIKAMAADNDLYLKLDQQSLEVIEAMQARQASEENNARLMELIQAWRVERNIEA